MITKRDLIVGLAVFCIAALLFSAIPVIGQTGQYDPWLDINDDGYIGIDDIFAVASHFGAEGEAINKTELLLQLQTKIAEMENRIEVLETLHGYHYPIECDWFNGLVGYWKLDEGSGTVAYDSSGIGNNGSLMEGPTWVDGKYGKALSFDGIDDYISIPGSQSLRVQNFTLEAWIYMMKRPYEHGDVHSAIINKLNFQSGSGTKGYKLMFEGPSSTDDHLVMSVGDGITQRFIIDYNSINDLTLNQWHHVMGTYDGATAKIYIDGRLKANATATYVVVNDDAPLGIGQEVTAIPIGPGYFNGLIDNALVYNRDLTAEEVLAHYVCQPP
jgi:hypothetical protein